MQYSLNYSGTRFVKLLSFLVDPFFKSSLIMVCHLKQMTHDHPLIRRDNSIKRSKCASDGADEPVFPLVPISDLLNAWMAMGLYNGRFDTKSFRDRYKLFQSRCKMFHVLGLKKQRTCSKCLSCSCQNSYILEVSEISQGCVVWLKGVCVETTGFRIRRDRGRPHRTWKGCLKLFLTHWTWIIVILITIVFQSCLTVSRSLRVLLVCGRASRHQRNRHIVIPIEPYYQHKKHFEHVLCFLSQVHETFYTSIETTCIDRETILYRNLRWLTPWPFKHSEGHW